MLLECVCVCMLVCVQRCFFNSSLLKVGQYSLYVSIKYFSFWQQTKMTLCVSDISSTSTWDIIMATCFYMTFLHQSLFMLLVFSQVTQWCCCESFRKQTALMSSCNVWMVWVWRKVDFSTVSALNELNVRTCQIILRKTNQYDKKKRKRFWIIDLKSNMWWFVCRKK